MRSRRGFGGREASAASGPPTSGTRAGDAIRSLRDERERLRKAHIEGLAGLDLVRTLAAAMDAAVGALWDETAGEQPAVALVALGGYGRGELSPHSDVDLMVLHAGARRVDEIARRIFYHLWDAGFQVGHATRTLRDSLRLAKVNFEAETSFLETRLVAGDARLFREFAEATLRQTHERGLWFVRAVRSAMEARHAKEGHASYLLEPNLKEGAGGLRDLHALGWLVRVFDGDLIDRRERDDLERAAELLHRVRNHLHFLTDRRTDVLLLDYQERTAHALGYQATEAEGPDGPVPGPRWSAWDAFMRDVYTAARSVEHAAAAALAELEAAGGRKRGRRALGDGLVREPARLTLAGPPSLAERPELPLALYAAAARERVPVALEAQRGVGEALERSAGPLPWTDAVRRAFFDLLGTGDPKALEGLDHAGALVRYLPEWRSVRCRPQHNVYHRFTVDVHAFETVARLARLDGEEERLAADVARDVRDRDALALAALLHDVGKGSPGDHSLAGEMLARAIAARMGLDDERTEAVAWLVRHHLLLVDTATRRDTRDENLVVETAAQVGDAERLRMLYVLSVADGLATGPTAWTPWKSALVAELFTKMLHVLEQGEVTSRDAMELVRLRTTELRSALGRYPGPLVETHLAGMPRAYFLAFPTTELIRHFALMAEPVGAGGIRTHVAPTEGRAVYELMLVAADRPGLFSKVSGSLALSGINIISAQIFTRADGVALEVFRVTGALEADLDAQRWERVFADVGAALQGRVAIDALLAQKRRAYAARASRGKREPPRVIVDNSGSDFYTIVEVHARDRIGLLYAITRALADLWLDIHVAKVATYGEDVVDVFYVWDLDGQKVTDPEPMAAIETAVLRALEGR